MSNINNINNIKKIANMGLGVALENKNALMGGGSLFVLGAVAWKVISFLVSRRGTKVPRSQELMNLSEAFAISPAEDKDRESFDDFLTHIPDYIASLSRQLLDAGETIAVTQDVTLNESLAAPEYGVYIGDGVFEAIQKGDFPEKGLLKGATYSPSQNSENLFRFCRSRVDSDAFYRGTSVKSDDGDTDFHVIDNPPKTYFDLPSFVDDAGDGYVYSVAPYLNNGFYTIFVTRLDVVLEQKACTPIAS